MSPSIPESDSTVQVGAFDTREATFTFCSAELPAVFGFDRCQHELTPGPPTYIPGAILNRACRVPLRYQDLRSNDQGVFSANSFHDPAHQSRKTKSPNPGTDRWAILFTEKVLFWSYEMANSARRLPNADRSGFRMPLSTPVESVLPTIQATASGYSNVQSYASRWSWPYCHPTNRKCGEFPAAAWP